jgi:hypothetical protein
MEREMTDAIKIEGDVIRKSAIETFGSGFQKLQIVVRTDGEYPQELPIEFHKDKADLAHKMINEGDRVELQCNLRGREWQGHDRWFLSLVAFRFDVQGAASEPTPGHEPDADAATEETGEEQTGMPF